MRYGYYIGFSVFIIFLIMLGMFFVYGLCQESNSSEEIKAQHEEEASVFSPLESEEEQAAQQKTADKTALKLGGSEIKLMLIPPQPLFALELAPTQEEEAGK